MKNFRFKSDGSFRICQFTDLHLDVTYKVDVAKKTFDLMRRTLDDTHPDLVTITGDLTWGKGTKEALEAIGNFFSETGYLWAPVLGNHDGCSSDTVTTTREDFAKLLLKCPNSLFETGTVDGNGNYILTLGDDEKLPEWVFYFMDSHGGIFYPSQLSWYRDISASLAYDHSELAFFHIPFPEYIEVRDYEVTKGFKMESVCTTQLNDGLFATMVRSGAMRGTFVGHDHINDYEGKLHDIKLCYGRCTGYNSYGLEGFPKGARIIDLKKGEKDFDTQIYLDTGELYHQKKEYSPKLKR